MRAGLLGLLGLALAWGGAPATLAAQGAGPSRRWGVGAGVGPTFPSGTFSRSDNPGASGLMYFSYSLGPRLAVALDVGATWLPRIGSGHTELYEVLAGAVWRAGPRAASPRPFLIAGIGSVAVNREDPDRGGRLAYGGGAGMSVGRADARLFVLVRYVRVHAVGGALSVFPVTFGFATPAP